MVASVEVHSRRLRFGPQNGTLALRTHRAGFASRIGHDLTIEVTAWSADVDVPDAADPGSGGVEATMDLSSLVVREGTGGAGPLTDRDRREIEGNSRRVLDVDHHRTASFGADQVTLTATGATISGTLVLRGTSAPVVLQVRELAANSWSATGTVAQSAFGIKPYSAFLGALKLRDEVEVEVECEIECEVVAREPPHPA